MNFNFKQIIHWIGRSLGALMAAFVAFMFVGNAASDGIGLLLRLTPRELLMMAALLIVFLGLILGWKWQKLGGWMVLGSMVIFYLLNFLFSGTLPRGVFFILIALPGLFYLIDGYFQQPQ